MPYAIGDGWLADFFAVLHLLDLVLLALLLCDLVVGRLGADLEQALRDAYDAVRVAE